MELDVTDKGKGRVFHSQYGEDRMLSEIFKSPSLCVEVGAHDGIELSNSAYFEECGWKCILVEPHPLSCRKIREKRRSVLFECAASDRSGSMTFHVTDEVPELSTLEGAPSQLKRMHREGGVIHEVTVPVRKLDDMLNEAGVERIAFVTIDVEGHELQVLKGFDIGRWKPRIVIVEDLSEGFDRTVPAHLAACGYVPWRMTGCNVWYSAATDSEVVNASNVRKFRHVRGFRRLKHLLPDLVVVPLRRLYRVLMRIRGALL